MSALRAPVAVPVELRIAGEAAAAAIAAAGGHTRVYRLARAVGVDGLRLERPAPFEIGRPLDVRFVLPDGAAPLALRAELALTDDDGEGERGGREVAFVAPPSEAREAIGRYVAERLGLPVGV